MLEFDHRVLVTGGGAARMGGVALQWSNSILGNLKNSIHGACPAIRGQHLPRELAEFNDRFKRRCDLTRLVDQLVRDAMRTPPMPSRLIKLAEVAW